MYRARLGEPLRFGGGHDDDSRFTAEHGGGVPGSGVSTLVAGWGPLALLLRFVASFAVSEAVACTLTALARSSADTKISWWESTPRSRPRAWRERFATTRSAQIIATLGARDIEVQNGPSKVQMVSESA